MTVTMDHKNSRKASWDSKMSVSTVSSANRQFRRSPSSIISSDSDIRFTRKKLSSQYKCGCCIIAGLLFFLLVAAAAIYIAYTFFVSEPPAEQVFRGMFRVVDGDAFSPELADPSTDTFRLRSRDYRERLNLLFRRSRLRYGFVGTEVLALDGNEGQDLIVHFNIHIDPRFATVDASDLVSVLGTEITLDQSPYFPNITIDSSSLDIKENYIGVITTSTAIPITKAVPPSTTAAPPPRRCAPLRLKYCSKLPYNSTTYPNVLGHKSLQEVEDNMIAFRELVDAECHRLAYDFVCQLLQPSCKPGNQQDELVMPCRSFCRDFMAGCGGRLQPQIKEMLDCGRFPEFYGHGSCRTKPECVKEMQSKALSPRICDGVPDCQDLTDETACSYCPPGHMHCGIGRVCIPPQARCDGNKDCPDGSDEKACLGLAPSIFNVTKLGLFTPHQSRYHSKGFVLFNEKGEIGKVCTDNLNSSLPQNETDSTLMNIAGSLCRTLTYQSAESVDVVDEQEENVKYVSMKNPMDPEISFVRTPCYTKRVLQVSCRDLECGLQTMHTGSGIQGLSKMSTHGDWPWHAALFKEDVHVCDATLVSPEWLVTTASCFQGQPKAEWAARLGTVRLAGTSPWQQERRIVGMVKSPVEGSTIAMVKLEEAVVMSDFVRPVCLPKDKSAVLPTNMSYCNALGWARNREQLQRVQLKLQEMEKCENISITSVNSVCTEAAYGGDDCNEEEFAGSPMLCLLPDGVRWSLVGVSNWRIACSQSGMGRPRLYDKITSNVDWIYQTVSAIL